MKILVITGPPYSGKGTQQETESDWKKNKKPNLG
jgi:adenylate kinase family enzyme